MLHVVHTRKVIYVKSNQALQHTLLHFQLLALKAARIYFTRARSLPEWSVHSVKRQSRPVKVVSVHIPIKLLSMLQA
eukprot:scaffold11726_cov161-Skeletonema_menzelii.AAC.3